jgi:YbbR domain-containing protein
LENDVPKKVKPSAFRRDYKLNQKIATFLFFLALASIFWLLNALDRSYSTNIKFPLKYIYHKADKEFVGNIPSEISLNISGHGYALLRNMFTSAQHPVVLKVISMPFVGVNNDTTKFYVLSKNLKESIQQQLGSELTLNYLAPDTLYYSFSPVVRKKVPVSVNIQIEFEKQFMQSGSALVQPDSIIISGPQAMVDTITIVNTQFKSFSKVNKTFITEMKLVPFEKVYLVRNDVNVTIPVEKYTESFIDVPIKAINIPDSFTIKTFPSTVRVNFDVSLRNYKRVSYRLFRVVVDYKTVNADINNKLKVKLERQPLYIRNVTFRPKSVDYIIER